MSKIFSGPGLGGTARQQGYAELTSDFIEKVDGRIGEIDERMQRELRGAAAEIAKLQNTIESRDRDSRARWHEAMERAGARDGRYRGAFSSRDHARVAGLLLLSKTAPDRDLRETARAELEKAAITPATGEAGGFLQAEVLLDGIIRNVDQYGTAERLFRVFGNIPATKVSRARRGASATVYFPDYGERVTESTLKVEKIQVDLTVWSTLATYDRWMAASDLAVTLAEFIADELGFAIALKQDEAAFIGDGSTTYARTVGIFKQPATDHLRVTPDGGGGITTFQAIIDAANKYLAEALGALPRWAHRIGPTWLMDHSIFFGFWGLQDASGKPLVQFLGGEAGVDRNPFRLMGYPVEFTGVGPTLSETAVSAPVISVGAYGRAWELYRHRRGTELAVLEELFRLEGLIGVILDVSQNMAEVDPNGYVNICTAAT